MKIRNWDLDGWTQPEWDDITDASDDLRAIASDFDSAVGGGGGGFTPAQLAAFTERLQMMSERIKRIAEGYV